MPFFVLTEVPTVAGSQLPALILHIASGTLVSIILALASWYFWEAQFLKLKQFFPYKTDDPLRSNAPGDTASAVSIVQKIRKTGIGVNMIEG
jgi:hypothetical protein